MSNVVVNARFLSRSSTGVDRVATELSVAIINAQPARKIVAIRPDGDIVEPDGRPQTLLDATRILPSRWSGQLWEQIALPRAAHDDVLLSMCNIGPVSHRKHIVMVHDAQVFREPQSYSRAFRTWYKTVQRILCRRAARVLTVSEHSKQEIVRYGLAPEGKIDVIPNGADHVLRLTPDGDVLARNGLKDDGYFLAIGSLAAHKNLDMLVSAARARTNRSIPLVIAGGGDTNVFGDIGITASEDVKVLGRVSDQELRALYDNAKALVFPSLTEGFGLPPAEAMMCGCPVVASTGGAVPEVCGTAALMLDPMDQGAWTRALEQVAFNTDLTARLSKQGRRQAAQFTWAAAAERLLAVVDQVDAGS